MPNYLEVIKWVVRQTGKKLENGNMAALLSSGDYDYQWLVVLEPKPDGEHLTEYRYYRN